MKSTAKNDWCEEGLKVLAKEGFQKITIENLCSLLNKTKGSFYHHFKNIDGFIKALMEYWLEKHTVEFIKKTKSIVDMYQKHIQLNSLISSKSQKIEQIIRAWSFSNEIVRKYVGQVDEMRIEYLIEFNMQTGMDAKEARNYAIIEYGTLIGIQQLCPNISKEDFENLYLVFLNKVAILNK